MNTKSLFVSAGIVLLMTACTQKPVEEQHDGYTLIRQDGPTLGYSPASGVQILKEGNHAFKDLNRNGQLDKYEDWRLGLDERIADLAAQLSREEIAGLMLYSNHQAIPSVGSFGNGTYDGKPYAESGAPAWALTDDQKRFLSEDNLRHLLITAVESPEVAARWNNAAQAFVEGLGHGIPVNNSSDPRHGGKSDSEFNAGAGSDISMWPNELGMGATFDPELMREFGRIASIEYRALGFATALSPQIDCATEPRWFRFSGTYGEDPRLVTDMAEAYCDGFQTSEGEARLYGAWGLQSVNAMAKHWPGGGPGEAGRDAHYGRGQYAVYPNGNYELLKGPFIVGAFNLKNTGQAAAIMPYYTISYGQSNEVVANNFNADIIGRQLREVAGYDGVVCTDWGVTADIAHPGVHSGKPYGVESLSVAERHCKALMAGVDQFGGNNDKKPVLEAFEMMAQQMGEEAMLQRIHKSAERLLRNIFQTGLFENPYLDPAESARIVGCPEFTAKGYEAQVKSIVMVKNHDAALPLKAEGEGKKVKVYVPQRIYPAHNSFWGSVIPTDTITPVKADMLSKFFEPVPTPEEADAAIVFIDSPNSGFGYNMGEVLKDKQTMIDVVTKMLQMYGRPIPTDPKVLAQMAQSAAGVNNYFIPKGSKVSAPGNGYYPISLQYRDYVAATAREVSLAGGSPFEKGTNRSYRGKGVRTFNAPDLTLVENTRKAMGTKKVIVVLNSTNPTVPAEFEPLADAILVTFDIQKQAILEVICGNYEPCGLLPFQMPADMETVEAQAEDTPRDMRCYKDADGNTYDFAFGMNWNGVIDDERVKRYKKTYIFN
jgi:beta-glucosidase